jgi:DedD protein
MERPVMQRLIGAAVLALLAIIFLPMILKPDVKAPDVSEVPLQMPKQPEAVTPESGNMETRELPLNVPGEVPAQGGVLGVPMTPVDAATGKPVSAAPTELETLPIATTEKPPTAAPVDKSSMVAEPINAKPVTSVQGEPSKTPVSSNPTVTTKPAMIEKPAIPMPKPPRPVDVPVTPEKTPVAMPKPPRPVDSPVIEKPVTKPAKLPEPVATAAAAGNYSISIGSFTNLDNANALVAKLRAQKLPVQTEKVSINGKSGMKVRIGPYADRASAETDRLKADAIAGSTSKVAAQLPSPAEKTVEKAAAKPAAAASSGTGFSVQLEALSVEADATKMRDRARSLGFNAFVKRVETEKGPLYSVRLGPVADRDAANKLRDDAAQKLGKTGIVKPHP